MVTQRTAIKNVPIKEKLLSGQLMLSFHFVLKRKQDDNKDGGQSAATKTTRKGSKEHLIKKDKHEDTTCFCYRI